MEIVKQISSIVKNGFSINNLGQLIPVLVAGIVLFQKFKSALERNQLELLLLGEKERKGHDTAAIGTVCVMIFFFNVMLVNGSIDSGKAVLLVALIGTMLSMLVFLSCFAMDCINKLMKKEAKSIFNDGQFFSLLIMIVLCCGFIAREFFYNYDVMTFIGSVSILSVIEGIYVYLYIESIRPKESRIKVSVKNEQNDREELFVYNRLNNMLLCGDAPVQYEAKHIYSIHLKDIYTNNNYFYFVNIDNNKVPEIKEDGRYSCIGKIVKEKGEQRILIDTNKLNADKTTVKAKEEFEAFIKNKVD